VELGLVVKHLTADPGISGLIFRSHNSLKANMNWFLPGKKLLCISVLHWGNKELGLSCVVDASVSPLFPLLPRSVNMTYM